MLITLVLGFMATQLGFKLPVTVFPIAIATLVGGVAILVIEQYLAGKPKSNNLTWSVAIWVALGRSLPDFCPVLPAPRRLSSPPCSPGMTLRPAATEFAFIVGIPVMFAATAFELLKARHDLGGADWSDLGLGFVISGIVAFIVVKWLLRYVQSHRFTVFAWYRIALGIALLAMLHQGIVH